MAKKIIRNKPTKQAMGANIEALFGGGKKKVEKAIAENTEEMVKELAKNFAMIPIAHIERNPDQPRYEFDEDALDELASSIKIHGIIQPLTVRYVEPKRYQIISGERRWRASKKASLKEVPAYIRVANDQALLEMAIIENVQREDLNPMEIANSYNRLKQECNLTDDQLSERLGKPRSTVTLYRGLLELHIAVQEAIKQEVISMGHAKAFKNMDILLQEQFLKEIKSNGWNVRQAEAKAKAYKKPKKTSKPKAKPPINKFSAEYDRILRDFKAFFGSGKIKFNLEDKETGKGQIVIPFENHDELTNFFKCIEQ
jgi:ParB family chromosome partitioning protein